MRMNRRKFLGAAAAGGTVAAGAVAAPALAQSMPEIRWRLASSYPKSLDTLYGASEQFARHCAEATDNKLRIQVFAPGEIVPALQVQGAVQSGTVEMGHTASYFYIGKDPTFAFDTAMPFGLNTRQQDAWMNVGGGRELMNEFFKDYNIFMIPCGNTGAQMGGWFRREIKAVADLQGTKMRIGGLAGQVMAKLGLVPQQIAGGEVYSALEKGAIDAAEWVGPYDDRKLGFNKVAPYYYFPGWWEGSAQVSNYINLEKWNELPKGYQAIMELAAAKAHATTIARYDVQNPKALRELIAAGTKLSAFSQPIMDACFEASREVYADISANNPRFKKIFESWKQFRNEEVMWFRVTENTFDFFMARQSANGKL